MGQGLREMRIIPKEPGALGEAYDNLPEHWSLCGLYQS